MGPVAGYGPGKRDSGRGGMSAIPISREQTRRVASMPEIPFEAFLKTWEVSVCLACSVLKTQRIIPFCSGWTFQPVGHCSEVPT